jgi:phospholipase C
VRLRRSLDRILVFVTAASLVIACSTDEPITPTATPQSLPATLAPVPTPTPFDAAVVLALAREHIKHVIVVMQENRSFDSYFGTYPGADGIPMRDGTPSVCVPDPAIKACVTPYHDRNVVNVGGPHHAASARDDVDGGRMDGFIATARSGKKGCDSLLDPECSGPGVDVMGYHDRTDIPNYWSYADNFVLEDHMFEPNASWSLPEHLVGEVLDPR